MKNIKILLASPRGFCAGVDRAITIVEKAIEKYGKPIYVRHEIVHNKFVVKSLEKKGAIFVEELSEVPRDKVAIFSAHGVEKKVVIEAMHKKIIFLDATCPLVSRVHRSVEDNYKNDFMTILIGHSGHPEVIGTMGQIPSDKIILIENVDDVKKLALFENKKLAWSTQTTLSVDETFEIIEALKKKFPHIQGPSKGDICFATTNRQNAIKKIAEKSNKIFVIGANNSSNSKRLVDAAKLQGCKDSFLINDINDVDWNSILDNEIIGVSAGASAPEILVNDFVNECKKKFNVEIKEIVDSKENVNFPLPRSLQ